MGPEEIKVEVTFWQNDDGVWVVEDKVSDQQGVADTVMTAFEEWYYGFVYAVLEAPPETPSKSFIMIRNAHEADKDA